MPLSTESRLWTRRPNFAFELLPKLNVTVEKAELFFGQLVVFETRRPDGTWSKECENDKSDNIR